jgi:tocopherol O-methyltransferase
MFTKRDVGNYYNATQLHYENWWGLKKSHSLHYGIWEKGITDYSQAKSNTNRIMMELCAITETDRVLDAGCGVGGAAIYINACKNAAVTGITLSEKQVDFANRLAKEKRPDGMVSFLLMDYTHTNFKDESFDVVWACESMSSAMDKSAFIDEAFRLLKRGGRLIVSDFFIRDENQADKHSWIKKWMDTWFINSLISMDTYSHLLKNKGFKISQQKDYTKQIQKSSKKLFYASILGAIPAAMYNLFNRGVSLYAKNHYKCGYYQYKALKKDLWKYFIVLAIK